LGSLWPAFGVPLAILGHILCYKRPGLRHQRTCLLRTHEDSVTLNSKTCLLVRQEDGDKLNSNSKTKTAVTLIWQRRRRIEFQTKDDDGDESESNANKTKTNSILISLLVVGQYAGVKMGSGANGPRPKWAQAQT